MKSVRRLFEKIARENPNWGSVIVFNHIVNQKNFSNDKIGRWFSILVDKNEYDRSEKKMILKDIYARNSMLNRTKNEGKTPLREEQIEKMGTDHKKMNKNGIDVTIHKNMKISPRKFPV